MPARADRKSPRPGEKSVTVTTRIPTEIYDRAFDEAQKRGTTVGREVERLIRAAVDLTAIFSRDNLDKVQLYNRIFINALQFAEDTADQSGFDVAFFDIVRRLLTERKGRTESVMTELERKMAGVFALVGVSTPLDDQVQGSEPGSSDHQSEEPDDIGRRWPYSGAWRRAHSGRK